MSEVIVTIRGGLLGVVRVPDGITLTVYDLDEIAVGENTIRSTFKGPVDEVTESERGEWDAEHEALAKTFEPERPEDVQ